MCKCNSEIRSPFCENCAPKTSGRIEQQISGSTGVYVFYAPSELLQSEKGMEVLEDMIKDVKAVANGKQQYMLLPSEVYPEGARKFELCKIA